MTPDPKPDEPAAARGQDDEAGEAHRRARDASRPAFPVPVKELLARYEQLYTGAINDVLREFCLLDQALPGYLTAVATRAHGGGHGVHGEERAQREDHRAR